MKFFLKLLFFFLSITYLYSSKIVNIYPINLKQSSEIYIKKNEKLKFSISGKWSLWNKYNSVGSEGHSFIANEYGNWGALIGQIGSGKTFIISNNIELISENEGVLYLFPNVGDYKIENQSGNLEVTINGGIDLDSFKKELANNAEIITYDVKDDFLNTGIHLNKGDTVEIYAFGTWTMWNNHYPKVSAEGHDFSSNGINWGKLFGGIGSSYGIFIEKFPIGEKTTYKSKSNGLLSLYPYISEYESDKDGMLEIYIIGGKKTDKDEIEKINEMVRKYKENQVLNKMNEIRTSLSLPKLKISSKLSQSASNHAKYLAYNNEFGREEKTTKLYFTGRKLEDRLKKINYTKKSYEMLCQTDSESDPIELFLNTVYHRLRILNPYLTDLGYGIYNKNNTMIHVFDFGYVDNKKLNFDWDVIVYPQNDTTEIETGWSGDETPDPFPVGTNKPLGYPLTIIFNNEIKKLLKAELIDENKNLISSFILSPNTDLNNKLFNEVIIVPKKELLLNTRYIINIKIIIGENKEEKLYSWSFITKSNN